MNPLRMPIPSPHSPSTENQNDITYRLGNTQPNGLQPLGTPKYLTQAIIYLAFGGSPDFLVTTKEVKALFNYPQTLCYKFRYHVFILADGPSRIQSQLHTTMSSALT